MSDLECLLEGCHLLSYGRGLCKGHYNQDYNARRYALDPKFRQRKIETARKQRTSQKWQASHWARCLKSKYRITEDEKRAMWFEQSHRCAICPSPVELQSSHVDHDHACCPGDRSCGKCVRGLLCGSCNRGIGFFHDDPRITESATRYLKDWSERTSICQN